MSGNHRAIPFLPGNSFPDVNKHDFRKPHSLGYKNGYAIQSTPILGIGLQPIESTFSKKSPADLLKSAGHSPFVTYGNKQFFTPVVEPRFVASHVAFDKVALRFDAYFKQSVHESTEQFHLRKVMILYFLEDDSIAVIEPPVENSGFPQGVLIKRHRIPKSVTEFYSLKDFNLAINITLYGKTFRIVTCDQFTAKYMTESENIVLNAPESLPIDPYQKLRARPLRVHNISPAKNDKLRRFLENDRKVLRFYCIWDDRESMFGELREFVIHYYLVDDSIEVREVQKPNNGRDPFPILLKRQQLPKAFAGHQDNNDSVKYTWVDFQIGCVIDVLGRVFLIRDCDDYTRNFISVNLGIDPQDIKPIALESEEPQKIEHEYPPYNGYGTVEDSLGSCKYLVLQPPKKDFIKMMENEHKILRFSARLDSKHKEDSDRIFVISYRLADDTMIIYEPPQRNAGTLGGKFMERTRVLLPGSSLETGPAYYEATDLYVGGRIEVLKHHFVLLDADEYVFNYMETEKDKFPQSNIEIVGTKVANILASMPGCADYIRNELQKADASGEGIVDRKIILDISKSVWGNALTDHEIITLCRHFEGKSRAVDFKKQRMSPTPHQNAVKYLSDLQETDDVVVFNNIHNLPKSDISYSLRLLNRLIEERQEDMNNFLSGNYSLLKQECQTLNMCRNSISDLQHRISDIESLLGSFPNEIITNLESEGAIVKEKYNSSCSQLELLLMIQSVFSLFDEYDDRIGAGDYLNASESLKKLNKLKSKLVEISEAQIIKIAHDRLLNIEQGMDYSLEYVFEQALNISDLGYVTEFSIKKLIEFTPGVPPVRSFNAFAAAASLDKLDGYLTIFCKKFHSKMILPVCANYTTMWNFKSEISPLERLGSLSHNKNILCIADPLQIIKQILEFLSKSIDSFESDKSCIIQSFNFKKYLGDKLYPELCNAIISAWLKDHIPKTFKELELYPEIIESKCNNFEKDIEKLGLCSKTGLLAKYNSNITQHFLKSTWDIVLFKAQSIILKAEYDYEIIEEIVVKDFNNVNDTVNGLFAFPKCAVGKKALAISKLVHECIIDGQTMDIECSKSIFLLSKMVLDLFRVLMLEKKPESELPRLSMVLYNDFQYLSRECLLLGFNFPQWPKQFKFCDQSNMFRMNAESIFKSQMDIQIQSLLEIFKPVKSFQVRAVYQEESLEKCINQIIHHLNSIVNSWKVVLSRQMHMKSISWLLEFVYEYSIEKMQSLSDITEEESVILNRLLKKMLVFEGIFDSKIGIHGYVKNFQKFKYVIELLDMSMVKIMEKFRSGELKDFSNQELVHWIKAIFADSNRREECFRELLKA